MSINWSLYSTRRFYLTSIQRADVSCDTLEKVTITTQKALENRKYIRIHTTISTRQLKNHYLTRKVKNSWRSIEKAKEDQDLQSHASQKTEVTNIKRKYIQLQYTIKLTSDYTYNTKTSYR